MGRNSVARTWGSTQAERELPFPCDRYVSAPDEAIYRAIDVEAPPPVVFRRLCQLRAAPYSYDLLDNFGRRSPRTLTPGLEKLAVGQRVMSIFELVEFETDRQITLRLRRGRFLRDLAVTYLVVPAGDGSRLLVKLVPVYRGGPLGSLVGSLLPWGDLAMMRKQLLNLKRLAEESWAGEARSS
jgi:hypothetical protein